MSQSIFLHEYLRALGDGGRIAALSGPERGFILAFLRFADDRGVAFPGAQTLAETLGMSLRNVERVRSRLIASGMLVRERSIAGLPSHYRLMPPARRADARPAREGASPRRGRARTPGMRRAKSPETDVKTDEGITGDPEARNLETNLQERPISYATIIPPQVEDVVAFGGRMEISPDECKQFFNYYEACGWVMGNGKAMRNWQSAMKYWRTNGIKGATNARNRPNPETRRRSEYDDVAPPPIINGQSAGD